MVRVKGNRLTSKNSGVRFKKRRSARLVVLNKYNRVNNEKLLQFKSVDKNFTKQTTIDSYYTKIEPSADEVTNAKTDTPATYDISLINANTEQALQANKNQMYNTCSSTNELKESVKVVVKKTNRKQHCNSDPQNQTLNCLIPNSESYLNLTNANYKDGDNRKKFNENRDQTLQQINQQLEEAVKLMENSMVKVLQRLKQIKQEKLQERVSRKSQESQPTIEVLGQDNGVDINMLAFTDLTITDEEKAQNMAFLRQITACYNKY